ncbi:MAG: hypothetical protein ACAH80_08005 [Alphaproteobacteria bacterium]
MSDLLKLFQDEAARVSDAQKQQAAFMEEKVMPMVNRVIAHINADKNLQADFGPGGDNGTYIHNSTVSRENFWAFNINFSTKDGTKLGTSKLYLHEKAPTLVGCDLKLVNMGGAANLTWLVEKMVRQAASKSTAPVQKPAI